LTAYTVADLFAVTLKRPVETPTSAVVAVVDAIVAFQIGRRLRSWAPFEIVRRRDDNHPSVGTYADRNHILVDLLAPPNSCIEAIANKIRQSGINTDLNGNLRILEQKLG
jgi:hypothetical protein